jgi:hypothetical protein
MARLPDPARSRAVLIGSSDYADPDLVELPGVRNNLTDLNAVLTSPRGTGLPAAHCTVLPEPTDAATVGEALAVAAREAEDLLLVYYAAHGLTSPNGGELYLALGNTRSHLIGTSALRCAEVRQAFLDSAARTRVLILDCCFSGRALGQLMSNPADALLCQVDVDGAFALTATQPNQLALAPVGQRNTLFTGELLRVLRDGVPGGPELLTMDVIYRHLKASLGRRNLPTPTVNNSGAAAHLALARNAAVRVAPTGDIVQLQRQVEELTTLEREYPSRVGALRAVIGELAEAETRTRDIYLTVLDKIDSPGLAPFAALAPDLLGRLSGLNQLAQEGKWTQLAGRLAVLRREAAEATEGTHRLRAMATGLLDRREELRGRLKVLLAQAVRLGIAEHDEVRERYAEAHRLLWSKPCDLREATTAVGAYQRSVKNGGGS